MTKPTASVLTGKGRKQYLNYFAALTNEQLLSAYQEEVAEKRWDQAQLAKQEMRERGLVR